MHVCRLGSSHIERMNKKDKILDFFTSKFPLNTDGLGEFIDAFTVQRYNKEEILLQANQKEKELRFLEEGVVREYFAHDGREMNTYFYTQPGFITDFSSITKNVPTRKYQQCLSNVTMRILPKRTYEAFLEKYECGRSVVNSIFQQVIQSKEQKEFKHFSLTPDQLYVDLLENHREWLQKVPQYHIATYLRMTPETLSRIRKRSLPTS